MFYFSKKWLLCFVALSLLGVAYGKPSFVPDAKDDARIKLFKTGYKNKIWAAMAEMKAGKHPDIDIVKLRDDVLSFAAQYPEEWFGDLRPFCDGA